MTKTFRSCSVYLRPDAYYVFAYMHTDYGEVACVPAVKVAVTAPGAAVAQAVLGELRERAGQPPDIDLRAAIASFRQHLKELGFRTVAAFEKCARVASVEFDGECYRIISHIKDDRGANVASGSTALNNNATVEDLAEAIVAALSAEYS